MVSRAAAPEEATAKARQTAKLNAVSRTLVEAKAHTNHRDYPAPAPAPTPTPDRTNPRDLRTDIQAAQDQHPAQPAQHPAQPAPRIALTVRNAPKHQATVPNLPSKIALLLDLRVMIAAFTLRSKHPTVLLVSMTIYGGLRTQLAACHPKTSTTAATTKPLTTTTTMAEATAATAAAAAAMMASKAKASLTTSTAARAADQVATSALKEAVVAS